MFALMPMLGGVGLAPLPASLLTSSMTVRIPVEDDMYGGTYEAPRAISGVRFERTMEHREVSGAAVDGGHVLSDDVRGRIFVDAASSPGSFEIPVRSLVSVDGGEEMEVVRTSRYEDFAGNTHHWEVEVR